MAPVIHCIRHAQGYHNLSVANHSMPDPTLTSLGKKQCENLAKDFPHHESIGAIVASPLRRTIYTALYGFKSLIERGMNITALPEVCETADVPCDTGSDIAVLKEEMKGKPVDLSRVKEGWNVKTGKWAPTADAIEKRAREARQWLKARPEDEIVVVTHGGFLHYFTEDWSDFNEVMGTGWRNVEYRSYKFADEDGENASLVETKQSREFRRGSEIPLTKEERINLRETAKKTWEEGGDLHPVQAVQAKRKSLQSGDHRVKYFPKRRSASSFLAWLTTRGIDGGQVKGVKTVEKMPFGINNPFPTSVASECKKAGKVLASFVDPRQSFGPDKVIPPQILASAKGLAIITVIKAGFLGSGRFGSGIVIARLSDGTWSAPSAIATGGGGFGGQIGFELTDFVFILNDAAAVRTFSQKGSLTLGGNVSIAAGPVGRNAEAAGAASLKGVAGVFSYSKTKGLFAGVSLEGSVLIERRDANEKLYNSRITARQLLEGGVRPPPAAEPLMRVLNSRVFAGVSPSSSDAMYNDIPIYDDSHDNVVWQGGSGRGYNEGVRTNRTGSMGNDYEYNDAPKRASTWNDDVYDRPPNSGGQSRTNTVGEEYSYSDSPKPGRPTAPKPKFTPKPMAGAVGKDQAIALFTFDADQPGDLAFKKGEIITITKRTENASDWWTGTVGNRTGIFPSNYVEAV
ncbi:MAG: hypothetical protein ASARMPRED_008501 [Alectoria sarmentosa]|nr:MAG: hypothetical protein ASARMPRED_008501 [Alectoria sarmentosa]